MHKLAAVYPASQGVSKSTQCHADLVELDCYQGGGKDMMFAFMLPIQRGERPQYPIEPRNGTVGLAMFFITMLAMTLVFLSEILSD
jgi:hypothetical protein